jgi:hypothetical protein
MSDEVRSLEDLLGASAATPEFKAAVKVLAEGGLDSRIAFDPSLPKVKILRAISKLLDARPDLAVENVTVEGRSGCSDFVGALVIQPGERRFEFVWDCRWRAERMGWTDPLGFPDQVRAAREFGYQCFQRFEEVRTRTDARPAASTAAFAGFRHGGAA